MATTLTAQEVLAQHEQTWDMPTLAETHPEMIEWVAERWDAVFPEDFTGQVYILDKQTHAMTKAGTTDVRVALKQVLQAEVEKG